MVSLAESENTESDEVLHDISSKTLIMDNNFNYIDSNSEVTDNTPIIEALPSMDDSSPSNSSSSSCARMSSDGYPKSDDSSDNQVVPECYDLDKEFMSRLQYYSDFTLDRQKKINTMVSHLSPTNNEDMTSDVTEELFTRHVEGAESPESPVKVALKPTVTSGSSCDYPSTPSSSHRVRRERSHRHFRNSRKSSSNPLASSTRIEENYSSSGSSRRSHTGSSLVPKASSTMIDDTFSLSSGSSGRRNRTGGSNPRACSTMLNESFLSSGSSGSSRQRSSSIPMANSTMISEANAVVPSIIEPSIIEPSIAIVTSGSKNSVCHSDDDCESIYTWSIHDDDGGSDTNVNLEQSYMRNITNSQKKGVSNKPPLPPSKRARSGSVSSRDSDMSVKVCQDQNLHKLLGETCSRDILERISAIEPNATSRDEALFVESFDECALPRANTIPRSSTKMDLKDKSGGSSSSAKAKDKSSGSSSMEARRASLPDLYSVCVDDFHSVPDSLASDSDDDNDISVLPERMRVPGKSSSSGEKDSSVSVSHLDSSRKSASSGQEVVKNSLIDSILTDSPNSVSSGGINAPHNSPGTNCSSSSRVSCSTTSDAKSSDSNINTRAPPVTLLPRNIVESPKLQNIKLPKASGGEMFKVPKQTQPLRKLFRFRKNKSKTPDLKISVPRQEPAVVHSDPQSKRELFPNGASNVPHEPKLVDKKAVIKKFRKFSDNFHKRDRSGRVKIETLANL